MQRKLLFTRTGLTAIATCLEDEIPAKFNPKVRIPEAICSASAKEIEHIFKRKENKMIFFPTDSDLASLAESLASYEPPSKGLPRNAPKISNLQKLLQTHHLSLHKDEEISLLSDTSGLSFDSKTSRNRYEIERRADQMTNKKVNDSIHQLKITQGINLVKAGVLTKELATTMELPYDDIVMRICLDTNNTTPESNNEASPVAQGIEEAMRTDELQHTNKIISIDEDPLHQSLPDSDMKCQKTVKVQKLKKEDPQVK